MREYIMTQFVNDFGKTICKLTENKVYSTLVFLCVGTDRITGDALGPIVGYKLKKIFNNTKNVAIIGDLEKIVCNCNIDFWVKYIRENFANPFIISIDSAFSNKDENIGEILVTEGGIQLGKGLKKDGYFIGDMSIKGIVAKDFGNSRKNFKLLQNIHLKDIMEMADVVADGIFNSIDIK